MKYNKDINKEMKRLKNDCTLCMRLVWWLALILNLLKSDTTHVFSGLMHLQGNTLQQVIVQHVHGGGHAHQSCVDDRDVAARIAGQVVLKQPQAHLHFLQFTSTADRTLHHMHQ